MTTHVNILTMHLSTWETSKIILKQEIMVVLLANKTLFIKLFFPLSVYKPWYLHCFINMY